MKNQLMAHSYTANLLNPTSFGFKIVNLDTNEVLYTSGLIYYTCDAARTAGNLKLATF